MKKISDKISKKKILQLGCFLLGVIFVNLVYQNFKYLLSHQSWYLLKKVELIGAEKVDPKQLIIDLELKKNTNLLLLDEEQLTQQIRKIERFKEARVSLKYPDTLVIVVKERVPGFLLRFDRDNKNSDPASDSQEKSELAVITTDRQLVAYSDRVKTHDLFVIELQGVSGLREALDHERLKAFIDLYQQLPEEERDIIDLFSGIKLAPYDSETEKDVLYLSKGGVKVVLAKLSLNQIRRARYAYLYVIHTLDKMVDTIEIQEDWVVIKERDKVASSASIPKFELRHGSSKKI